jgi:hypothetical protein
MKCHYCGTTDDTRPYGPGGSSICFPCMKADPEREKTAEQSFVAQVEAAAAMSPYRVVVVNTAAGGPEPLLHEDLSRPEQ